MIQKINSQLGRVVYPRRLSDIHSKRGQATFLTLSLSVLVILRVSVSPWLIKTERELTVCVTTDEATAPRGQRPPANDPKQVCSPPTLFSLLYDPTGA